MRQSVAAPHKEIPVRGRLLTMAEASGKIGMSEKWIYNHMVNGTLPFPWFMPSPGKRFLDSSDLDDFLLTVKVPAGEARRRSKSKKKEVHMEQ
jgi:predicted DNA-binding transcriptional regulator AlpA